MTHVLHRRIGHRYPTAVSGKGISIRDADGKDYIDASGGIAVSCLGRGRGLFRGLELVADRGTKEPFDPARKLHARVKQEAMMRGLMVYPTGGTIDGTRGDHVLLAPPFIVDRAAIDAIVDRLGDAIDSATGR